MPDSPQDSAIPNEEEKETQKSIINDLDVGHPLQNSVPSDGKITDQNISPASHGQGNGSIINDLHEPDKHQAHPIIVGPNLDESSPPTGDPDAEATEDKSNDPKPDPSDVRNRTDEIDLWWGAHSIWGMAPSLTICALLTAAIIAGTMIFTPESHYSYRRIIIVGLAGAVWLMQLPRLFFRMFGYTYRLTTRRLYVNRGWVSSAAQRIDLTDIKSVRLESSWWGDPLKVGRIIVESKDLKSNPIQLDGVRNPVRVLKRIQNTTNEAKENVQKTK